MSLVFKRLLSFGFRLGLLKSSRKPITRAVVKDKAVAIRKMFSMPASTDLGNTGALHGLIGR